jgi:hypothetical protein
MLDEFKNYEIIKKLLNLLKQIQQSRSIQFLFSEEA